MKLVLVKWVDAVTYDHGWRAMTEVRQNVPSKCQTVGWILRQTKSHITLVNSTGEADCDGDMTIPMGMVKEIIPLVPKK